MKLSKKTQWIIGVFIALILIGSLASKDDDKVASVSQDIANTPENENLTKPQITEKKSEPNLSKSDQFNINARKRFDYFVENVPEIGAIDCLEGDCSSVAYFRFKTIPDDLEDGFMRGQTATFSKFKLDHLGVSHVTLYATNLEGRILLQCDASKGIVESCE